MNEKTFALSDWIITGGGPHVVMASTLLSEWFGSFESPTPREAKSRYGNPNDPATDYDRACDVKAYFGGIEVGKSIGFVLGEELVETCVAIVEEQHVLIVRPLAGGGEGVKAAIAYSFGDEIVERIDSYVPTTSKHGLFDSAYPGIEAEEIVWFELPEQRYAINTYLYKPNKKVYVITHRFIPY